MGYTESPAIERWRGFLMSDIAPDEPGGYATIHA